MRRTIVRSFALVAVLALAAGCGEDEPTVQPPLDPSPQEGVVGVATLDNNFAPSRVDAPAGEEVTVRVENNGQNPHTFTISELGVDTGIIQSGESAEVTLTVPDEPIEFVCTVHPEMRGTLHPG